MQEPAKSELFVYLDVPWGHYPENTMAKVIEERGDWVFVLITADGSNTRMWWPFTHCHFVVQVPMP